MKLHCRICSCQGTHISEDSAIATIDASKLRLPLEPTMFTSLNPERGIPTPWRPGVDWQTMRCPRGNHLPWGIDYADIEQAMKDGGPKQILTDEGMIDVQSVPTSEILCPKCGKEFKSRAGQVSHTKTCSVENVDGE